MTKNIISGALNFRTYMYIIYLGHSSRDWQDVKTNKFFNQKEYPSRKCSFTF